MAKKVRFLNAHKEWLRDNLIKNFEKAFFLTHEAAVEAVTGGSVPAYIDIGRRIVHNCPDYETTHRFTINDVKRAIGEWLAYKAGVRIEGAVSFDPNTVPSPTIGENGEMRTGDEVTGVAVEAPGPEAPAESENAVEESIPAESEAESPSVDCNEDLGGNSAPAEVLNSANDGLDLDENPTSQSTVEEVQSQPQATEGFVTENPVSYDGEVPF